MYVPPSHLLLDGIRERQRMTVTANCEFKESPDTNLCHSHTEPELHLST